MKPRTFVKQIVVMRTRKRFGHRPRPGTFTQSQARSNCRAVVLGQQDTSGQKDAPTE